MPKPVLLKTPKVVPLTDTKRRVIASDEKSKRFILAIGNQRIAFDFTSRVTELPRGTGDRPAPVLPMKKSKKRNR
jgi:hypothetical protein